MCQFFYLRIRVCFCANLSALVEEYHFLCSTFGLMDWSGVLKCLATEVLCSVVVENSAGALYV